MNSGSVITVHSYKGGTGKTLVSTNLAGILARQGKNVCLIDLDLRAPSLDATFAANGKYWINDYLSGTCEPIDTIKDFSKEKNTSGKLFVALAYPLCEFIRKIQNSQSLLEKCRLNITWGGAKNGSKKESNISNEKWKSYFSSKEEKKKKVMRW